MTPKTTTGTTLGVDDDDDDGRATTAMTDARANASTVKARVVTPMPTSTSNVEIVNLLSSEETASEGGGTLDEGGEAARGSRKRAEGRAVDVDDVVVLDKEDVNDDAPAPSEVVDELRKFGATSAELAFVSALRAFFEERGEEFAKVMVEKEVEERMRDRAREANALEANANATNRKAACIREACLREAKTKEHARAVVCRALKTYRDELRKWERAVVRAQVAPASTSDASPSSSAREDTLTLPFWRHDRALVDVPSKTVSVKTQVAVQPFSSHSRNRRSWKMRANSVKTQKVRCVNLGSSEAVPPYNYFAYSTHCNSFNEHDDNQSRLLYKDEEGEFVEDQADDIEQVKVANEFTREEEFVLGALASTFSRFVLFDHVEVNGMQRETVVKHVVEEVSSILKMEEEIVVDWLNEARTTQSTSRAWCMFLEAIEIVCKLWSPYSKFDNSESLYKLMGGVCETLAQVDTDGIFWQYFAQIVINAPTMAPLKKPVIIFDTLEEATAQLSGAFCPRCFVFDCRTHGSLQPKSRGRKQASERKLLWRERMHKKANVNENDLKCSHACWYQSSEYKYLATRGVVCGSCDPSERSPLSKDSETEDPFAKNRRKWRNVLDVEILKKAVEVLSTAGGKPTACDVTLFFGKRRACADIGRQIHSLELISSGAIVADEDVEEGDEDVNGKNKAKKRKHRSGQTKKKNPTIANRLKRSKTDENALVTQYTPCDCEGQCDAATCSCIQKGIFCERFCNCGPNCDNEFPGCKCETTKKTCRTNTCPCFAAGRECTPDKCRRCCKTADALMLPIRQKYGFVDPAQTAKIPDYPCGNMKLQLRQKEHVCLGKSGVAGWGAHVLHGARKDDFIGEYVGELVTQDEADRRGMVYDRNNCSYLFDLNSEFCIDAQNRGNKLRFANHSVHPNVRSAVMAVNGDNRLAMFALRDIAPGEELFFDYRYKDEVAPEWHEKREKVEKDAKSAKKSKGNRNKHSAKKAY